MFRACAFAACALSLTACAEEEPLDTSYEKTLPAPVADAEGEGAQENMSTDGRDEAVDAIASGDNTDVPPAE